MPSLIPQNPWARRLVYELIYGAPGTRRAVLFNVGFAPVRPDTRALAPFAEDASQIQLYAELCDLAAFDQERWRASALLEIGAGRGGGLAYIQRHHRPQRAIGIDMSYAAAWRGRRLGVDMRQGDGVDLRFDDGAFDIALCIDTLKYFPQQRFADEARRVLRPGGHLLLGDSTSSPAAGESVFRALAGFEVLRIRDVSEGVRLAIRQRSARMKPSTSWVPWLLRDRWRSTMMIEGSSRYDDWQSGRNHYLLAVLRRSTDS
jgi:SAM-dependent methyltransferase